MSLSLLDPRWVAIGEREAQSIVTAINGKCAVTIVVTGDVVTTITRDVVTGAHVGSGTVSWNYFVGDVLSHLEAQGMEFIFD